MKMIEQEADKYSGVHLSKLFTQDKNHGCWNHLKNCFVIVTIYHWHVLFTKKQIGQMLVKTIPTSQLLPLTEFTEKFPMYAANVKDLKAKA